MYPTGLRVRRRLVLLLCMFPVLFMVLIVQLFRLQVLQGQDLQMRAQTQWTMRSVIAPRRGSILDRNGQSLAVSATAYTVSVNPRQVNDADAFAREAAILLDLDEALVKKRAADKTKGGVTLKRQVPLQEAEELRAEIARRKAEKDTTLSGLYFELDSRRYYPMGEALAQVLGLTTIDGAGQAGLELTLDDYLSGKSGRVLTEVDGKGRELPYSASEYVAPVNGGSVTLTIDAVIQSFAEKAMREAMAVNGARSMQALVMDVKTGEILALASQPEYDPNHPPRDNLPLLTDLMRDRLVCDAYEPGSTFKILTSAIALDVGVTNPNEGFFCSGSVTVDGGKIRCWGNPHGAESMAQALCNSCNPVFVELGLRIGVARMYEYLSAFGLGTVTGVDLPGEIGGILIPEASVKRVDMARIGFGQSVAVTPIQILSAACAVANNGTRMRPYIVSEIRDVNGELIEKNQPTVVAQTIKPETSVTMRKLLEQVVTTGGGRNAYIPGYRVMGKTGTAQVYDNGVILADSHIGSFLGFAPADDPKVAVLVIADAATIRPDFGSITAAPFARDILEETLMYLGVPLRASSGGNVTVGDLMKHPIPDLVGLSVGEAEARLKEAGFGNLLSGQGNVVVDQLPAPGASAVQSSVVVLYLAQDDAQAFAEITIPDVLGKTIVEANRRLSASGLNMELTGTGIAIRQQPAAGEMVYKGRAVSVTFSEP